MHRLAPRGCGLACLPGLLSCRRSPPATTVQCGHVSRGGRGGNGQRCSTLRVWSSSLTLPWGRRVFVTRLLTGTEMVCDKILRGPGPAAPAPSCPSLAPSVRRAWKRLCRVPWRSRWRGPGQHWPGTWPPSRPSLVACGCQREESLIFTR